MSRAMAVRPGPPPLVSPRRPLGRFAGALMLTAAACGGDDSAAPGPVDAAAPEGGCAPQLSTPWIPTWRPPRASPHACTDTQIDREYELCESDSTFSAAECAAFNRAPANAACRRCLYATEDESSYGPLVYLANRILRINVAGCLALADGNVSASGCGAELQAFDTCGDAACMKACAAYNAFTACADQAGETVCRSYGSASACSDSATYAPCLGYTTFAEYYRGIAKLFCAAGFPGPGVPEGGAADAGAADAGSESGGQSHRVLDRGVREMPARGDVGEGIER